MLLKGKDEVTLLSISLKFRELGEVEVGYAVDHADFTKGSEEIISSDSGLALEPREPKSLCGGIVQVLAHFAGKIIVDNVLEVNLVKIICPGVEHGEALMLDALGAVLHDILLDKGEVGFVSAHGVGKIVFSDNLLGVANKRADSLDAGAGLQVLVLNLLVELSHKLLITSDTDGLQDTHKHLLEAFQVPVLVDGSVDDAGREHLLGLGSEQVNQVVKVVDLNEVLSIFGKMVGQKLFTEEIHSIGQSSGKLDVLAGILA